MPFLELGYFLAILCDIQQPSTGTTLHCGLYAVSKPAFSGVRWTGKCMPCQSCEERISTLSCLQDFSSCPTWIHRTEVPFCRLTDSVGFFLLLFQLILGLSQHLVSRGQGCFQIWRFSSFRPFFAFLHSSLPFLQLAPFSSKTRFLRRQRTCRCHWHSSAWSSRFWSPSSNFQPCSPWIWLRLGIFPSSRR